MKLDNPSSIGIQIDMTGTNAGTNNPVQWHSRSDGNISHVHYNNARTIFDLKVYDTSKEFGFYLQAFNRNYFSQIKNVKLTTNTDWTNNTFVIN